MARVFVSVGSNIDRERKVPQALEHLQARYGELTRSSLYESPAQGFEGADFYNMVVLFEASDTPYAVNDDLREIEARLDRVRSEDRFVSRTIDLDVLMYDDWVVDDDLLSLPHDDILHQDFVLGPLAEIGGEQRHPVIGVTIAELWQQWQRENAATVRAVSEPWSETATAVNGQNLAGHIAGIPDKK